MNHESQIMNQKTVIGETIATWLASSTPDGIPAPVEAMARRLLVDVTGLCVAARREDYVAATLAAADAGPCTAIGHSASLDAFGAALVNGTAAHGEDFDDTFEGGPVHSGAVVIPALLAACERERLGGDRLLVGVATGVELLCRLSLVAPMATHKAGFHPTAVFGTVAASAGVAAALKLPADAIVSALGISGSMASGIIEYLAEGTWTKRMHAGWAAQSGIRAALLARGRFVGPRTVFEGVHGFYRAFAPSRQPDFAPLVNDLGKRWVMQDVAFKPYACGTMAQPFIDCAIQLAASGVAVDEIEEIVCEVAEGTVHRLWEPLASKHRPPTPYAAKFSTPYCMAVGFVDGKAGFEQFTHERVADEDVLRLASRIRYAINPADEYPKNFTGHLRARLHDGTMREFRQPHMRGGAHSPLTDAEIEAKFMDNARYGGWSSERATHVLARIRTLFDVSWLDALAELRS
jgi:2-methylcitrate dehydratase PrpD